MNRTSRVIGGLCGGLLAIVSFAAPAVAAAQSATPLAGRGLSGRWQGIAQVPGAPTVIVLDLDQADGRWVGSVTAPGHAAKGIPLTEVVCTDDTLTASAALFGGAKVRARAAGDRLAGTLEAGGNTATMELARVGAAQVDLPPRNTALAAAFEGEWKAEFELGWKQSAELSLHNEAGGTSKGEMKIGGGAVKLVRIVQDGSSLQFRVGDTGIVFEGRLDSSGGTIDGHLYVAGLEGTVRWQGSAKPTAAAGQEAKR